MKITLFILLLVLLICTSCSSSSKEDSSTSILVERWYISKNGKESLYKEIFWSNFDDKIMTKKVIYSHARIEIETYSNKLLKKAYLIDNTTSLDTFMNISYYYDDFSNINRIEEIKKDSLIIRNIETKLDSITHKPTLTKVISSGVELLTYIYYSKNEEISRTFKEDSLVFFQSKHFNNEGEIISKTRKSINFPPIFSDSIYYEYKAGRLIKEMNYFNDEFTSSKDYIYENDTLTKIVKSSTEMNKIEYLIRYSKNK